MLSVRHYQADWISKWFEGPVKWEKEKKKKKGEKNEAKVILTTHKELNKVWTTVLIDYIFPNIISFTKLDSSLFLEMEKNLTSGAGCPKIYRQKKIIRTSSMLLYLT